ncbi:MAG: hypothetical protein QOK03_1352 [Candidatus Binataceae bacterium]|nr:hypothetical protein [Candidatus Binataceae bacterium]
MRGASLMVPRVPIFLPPDQTTYSPILKVKH